MRGIDLIRLFYFVLQSIFLYKANSEIHQAPIRLARPQRVDFIEAAFQDHEQSIHPQRVGKTGGRLSMRAEFSSGSDLAARR